MSSTMMGQAVEDTSGCMKMEGALMTQDKTDSWTERHCQLVNEFFMVFKSKGSTEPLESIDVRAIETVNSIESSDTPAMEIILLNGDPYVFKGMSKDMIDVWVKAVSIRMGWASGNKQMHICGTLLKKSASLYAGYQVISGSCGTAASCAFPSKCVNRNNAHSH
jgi:PH domain